MTVLDDGTYLEIEGRAAVRFERRYAHPIDRVWRAVTDPAELARWFPSREVRFDPEPALGATIHLSGDPYDPEGSSGKVLAWDPPRHFAFEWGPDELRLTLHDDEDGCRLEFVDLLDGDGGASRNAAGWTMCLHDLDTLIAGAPASGPHQNSDTDFRALLEDFKSKGFPDDGWLPDNP